jgi:hypothetical protein
LTAGDYETWRRYLGGAAGENVGDLIMSGKKPLPLPRRLEPFHDPLSSAGRLMRILRPVVEAFLLQMLDAGHDPRLGRGVAAQLVGDQHPRHWSLLLQDLRNKRLAAFLSRRLCTGTSRTKLSWSTARPGPVLLAEDLIKVPFAAPARGWPTDAVGEFVAESQVPLADRLVYERKAASRQHLLDHAQIYREPEIQPGRLADEFGGSGSQQKWVWGCRHLGRISDHPGFAKPDGAPLDGAVESLVCPVILKPCLPAITTKPET